MIGALLDGARPKLRSMQEVLIARVMSIIARFRAWRGAWGGALLLLASLVFVAGSVVSISRLDLSSEQLRLYPLAFLVLVFVPLTIAYSAVNMMVMGHAARARIGFWQGVKVTVYAQIAELLPVPGGIAVRAAALMKASGKGWQSVELVLAFSILWVACASVGAGIALGSNHWIGFALAAGGLIISLGVCAWIAIRFGGRIALAALGLRLMGLILTALRLATSFSIIGLSLPFLASFTFAFSTIAGSAASIAPGGLGIGESLSALLAGPSGVAPAAAFLAVALSRLSGVAVNLLLVGLFMLANLRQQVTARENDTVPSNTI